VDYDSQPEPIKVQPMTENTKVVLDFIAAWKRQDLDEIMGFFTEDCFYHNIPVEPIEGIAAVRATLAGFSGMATAIEWLTHQVAETQAGVVLTERTDRFEIGGKWVEIPVMGAFELRDGKITRWRDYFDMAQFQNQLPQGGA
jgi:limonene-1,2-epoxide hydrolase